MMMVVVVVVVKDIINRLIKNDDVIFNHFINLYKDIE